MKYPCKECQKLVGIIYNGSCESCSFKDVPKKEKKKVLVKRKRRRKVLKVDKRKRR